MSAIEIRRARVDDAAALARLMADRAVFAGLMQMPYVNEEAHRARLTEGLVPGKIDLNFVAERSGEIVGNAGLHPCGPATRRRHAMSIGMSVAREVQRQGVGTALMQALCDYADRWIAALRLELTVYANNEPAIALYRKFGFEMEGRHRAYALRDGVYVDALAMARLNPNPPAAQPA